VLPAADANAIFNKLLGPSSDADVARRGRHAARHTGGEDHIANVEEITRRVGGHIDRAAGADQDVARPGDLRRAATL